MLCYCLYCFCNLFRSSLEKYANINKWISDTDRQILIHIYTHTQREKRSDKHMKCSKNKELFWRWFEIGVGKSIYGISLKRNIYNVKSIDNYIVLSAMAIEHIDALSYCVYVKMLSVLYIDNSTVIFRLTP